MSEDNLEPLVTQCPNCETRFRVTEAQLQVAQGRVRCGACLAVFDGAAYLSLDGEAFDTGEEAEDVDQLLEELEVAPIPEPGLAAAPAQVDDAAGQAPAVPAIDAESQDPDMPDELLALEAEFLRELRAAQDEEEEGGEDADLQSAVPPVQVVTPQPELPQPESPSTAEEHLVLAEPLGLDGVPEPESEPEPEPKPESEPEAEPEVVELQTPAYQGIDPQAVDADAATEPLQATPANAAQKFHIPELELPELEAPDEPASKRSWFTIVLIVLALIGLPAQVLWFQYESWVKDAGFRPIYQQICNVAGCELPPMRDISQIVSKKSVIRVHPERSDARIVDVLMVNNADFAQPFPLIELMATTIRGQLVAGRRFKPQEYLQGEMANSQLMPPRTPVHVSLEIQDPGEDALNFEVRFR